MAANSPVDLSIPRQPRSISVGAALFDHDWRGQRREGDADVDQTQDHGQV
jgi:hypothetical protein